MHFRPAVLGKRKSFVMSRAADLTRTLTLANCPIIESIWISDICSRLQNVKIQQTVRKQAHFYGFFQCCIMTNFFSVTLKEKEIVNTFNLYFEMTFGADLQNVKIFTADCSCLVESRPPLFSFFFTVAFWRTFVCCYCFFLSLLIFNA